MGFACLYWLPLFLCVVMDSTRLSDSSLNWRISAERCTGHFVLLRSDGTAVACGDNRRGQCNIPDLVEGVTYTQADTGRYHTVSLASDGIAVACGSSEHGECNIPALSGGIIYTQAAVGCCYTVLLMSDGTAVVCGVRQWKFPASSNCCWRPNIPTLPDDVVWNSMSGASKQIATTKRSEQCRSTQQGTRDPEQTATTKDRDPGQIATTKI